MALIIGLDWAGMHTRFEWCLIEAWNVESVGPLTASESLVQFAVQHGRGRACVRGTAARGKHKINDHRQVIGSYTSEPRPPDTGLHYLDV